MITGIRQIKYGGNGKDSCLFVIPISKDETDFAESVAATVSSACPHTGFTLAFLLSDDWDADYSPWQMDNGQRHFAGNGNRVISEIRKFICNERKNYSRIYVAGYSLAGLMALWAVYETDLFDGCACCSGSLWFCDWEQYIKSNDPKKDGVIYLSLGGREDKSPDPVISSILVKTKLQDKMLSYSSHVVKHVFEMNKGGHFASPDRRLAKGIIWLMKEGRSPDSNEV